jgi:ubiquinone/menaquinone biosynthesis C-methylase UbiE
MTTATPHVRNRWIESKCAKAFWGQHDLAPYQRLLADTLDWADPRPGQCWLDLGCGGGAVTRALWERSGGSVARVVGVDCAAANESAYRRLHETLSPAPGGRVRFVCHNFSAGLAPFQDGSFDHAVSGLSIQYAEDFDARTGTWTSAAYDRLLADVFRVLRPGGRFVFSVNVPEPSWLMVGLRSAGGFFRTSRPLRFLKTAWRMWTYGVWLKQEARRGRFHYLPAETVADKLSQAGYEQIEHRGSYAGQAYIFRAIKPV